VQCHRVILALCLLQVTATIGLRRTIVQEEVAPRTNRKDTQPHERTNRSVGRRVWTSILAEVIGSVQSQEIASLGSCCNSGFVLCQNPAMNRRTLLQSLTEAALHDGADLANKLLDFRTYCNSHRTHTSREVRAPDTTVARPVANLRSVR
jgi:hypothetical protein